MDKHIPNEKELIRPRRLCLRREIPEPGAHNFACGANYLAARWFNSACGANYPYQALKGGYFFYFCAQSTFLESTILGGRVRSCGFPWPIGGARWWWFAGLAV